MILLIVFGVIAYGCKEDDSIINDIQSKTELNQKLKDKADKSNFIEWEEYSTLDAFFDRSNEKVYFIQKSGDLSFEYPTNAIEINQSAENNELIISSNSEVFSFGFASNVDGIGWMSQIQAQEIGLLINENPIILNPDNDLEPEAKCGCYSIRRPTNCNSGGDGSTGCSVGGGGGCSVSCRSTFSACCTTDSNFSY